MENQIWRQPAGSVRGGLSKVTRASASTSVWEKAVPQFPPWCHPLQFLPVCHWCLSNCYPSAEAQKKWVWLGLCAGSLRGTAWDSGSFFHWLNARWPCSQKLWGLISLALERWAAGLLWGWDSPLLRYVSWTFIYHMWMGDQSVYISTPPTILDRSGFFNSIVVRLPFNSISDRSEGWSFYIWVVILMWLDKEVSHVYLRLHLNQKSLIIFHIYWKFHFILLWIAYSWLLLEYSYPCSCFIGLFSLLGIWIFCHICCKHFSQVVMSLCFVYSRFFSVTEYKIW